MKIGEITLGTLKRIRGLTVLRPAAPRTLRAISEKILRPIALGKKTVPPEVFDEVNTLLAEIEAVDPGSMVGEQVIRAAEARFSEPVEREVALSTARSYLTYLHNSDVAISKALPKLIETCPSFDDYRKAIQLGIEIAKADVGSCPIIGLVLPEIYLWGIPADLALYYNYIEAFVKDRAPLFGGIEAKDVVEDHGDWYTETSVKAVKLSRAEKGEIMAAIFLCAARCSGNFAEFAALCGRLDQLINCGSATGYRIEITSTRIIDYRRDQVKVLPPNKTIAFEMLKELARCAGRLRQFDLMSKAIAIEEKLIGCRVISRQVGNYNDTCRDTNSYVEGRDYVADHARSVCALFSELAPDDATFLKILEVVSSACERAGGAKPKLNCFYEQSARELLAELDTDKVKARLFG